MTCAPALPKSGSLYLSAPWVQGTKQYGGEKSKTVGGCILFLKGLNTDILPVSVGVKLRRGTRNKTVSTRSTEEPKVTGWKSFKSFSYTLPKNKVGKKHKWHQTDTRCFGRTLLMLWLKIELLELDALGFETRTPTYPLCGFGRLLDLSVP
jgi:hypothetical protein